MWWICWLGCSPEEPPPIVLPPSAVPIEVEDTDPRDWVREDERGTFTLRREGPSYTRPQQLTVAAVFGPELDGLAYPATCALDGHLCVGPDEPLDRDRFDPAELPAVDRYSWLGDTLAVGAHEVPFRVLPGEARAAGYHGLLALDVPLVDALPVRFSGGEWHEGGFEVALPPLITGLEPSPSTWVAADPLGLDVFRWAPRGGELWLTLTGETFSSVRRIEDDGSVWVDTRAFRLGEPVEVRLTRVEDQGEVQVGTHRVQITGMAEQTWCLTDGCPDLPYPLYPTELDFEFCWNGSTCQPSQWRLYEGGTWSSGSFTGTWTFDCCRQRIELVFVSGTRYWAQLTEDGCYEGEMLSWSGNRGTWNSCYAQ